MALNQISLLTYLLTFYVCLCVRVCGYGPRAWIK